jgi:hypothetical protein
MSSGISDDDVLTYTEFCKHFHKMCVAALGTDRKVQRSYSPAKWVLFRHI